MTLKHFSERSDSGEKDAGLDGSRWVQHCPGAEPGPQCSSTHAFASQLPLRQGECISSLWQNDPLRMFCFPQITVTSSYEQRPVNLKFKDAIFSMVSSLFKLVSLKNRSHFWQGAESICLACVYQRHESVAEVCTAHETQEFLPRDPGLCNIGTSTEPDFISICTSLLCGSLFLA